MHKKALARGILWGLGIALLTCAMAWLAEVGQGGAARLFQSLALFLAAGSVAVAPLNVQPVSITLPLFFRDCSSRPDCSTHHFLQ